MKGFTIFGIFAVSFLLLSETLAHSSSEEEGDNFFLNHQRCHSVGTKVVITRPDGSSESCTCQAPPTTTTAPTTTTGRPGRRPRPVPKPRNTWECTSTLAGSTTTTTAPITDTTITPTTTTDPQA
ncbi:integumentary mucin C.1 [Folsomia candida]|uniref:Uncharacterized protein n=1 Tax=Folsomia candida TaxID=158441 RepID=A0A226DY69_FOLCA|nr:integumentary mucin C.1 [Folsomia candida]OXA49631.1 hypothetical protein Fcan01_15552 [Folsomia candida]